MRTPYSVEGCGYPVYLVESGLHSPCLFGLVRPAVYLTPAAVSSPDSLRHVLAHETTHARHLDPLWSLVRCVCLAVYWFDPLVWAAALVSRSDCELACDEGALEMLGEDQRIPYGQTLLALIPVRKGPSSPFLTATTMTAGKKQLKDRITRIAEKRRTVGVAVFLVLALTLAACAATFTAAREPEAEQNAGPTTLTQAELAELQEMIFSSDAGGFSRSQFLTHYYDSPENVDLYQLFYNGAGLPEAVSDEERRAVADALGYDPEIDLTKCPAREMESVLNRNLNVTLSENDARKTSNRVGLDSFVCLPEYDAYYHFHGDTNGLIAGQAVFLAGEREGVTLRLFYDASDIHFDEDYACLTLEEYPGEAEDGFCYYFVSNQPCPADEVPGVRVIYPDWDPVLTIPLADSTIVTPEEIPLEPIAQDAGDEFLTDCVLIYNQPWAVRVYDPADGGDVYACLVNMLDSSSRAYRFQTIEYDVTAERVAVQPFRNVLGHDGFKLSYNIAMGTQRTEYYVLSEDRALTRLFACNDGYPEEADFDGDGQKEVLIHQNADEDGPYFLFSGDGTLRRFAIGSLLKSAWPEASYLEIYGYPEDGCLAVTAQVPIDGAPEPSGYSGATAFRWLYFDGKNLLLYKDETPYNGHVKEGIDAPGYAVAAAKTRGEELLTAAQADGSGNALVDGEWQIKEGVTVWDDYRITRLVNVPAPEICSAQRVVQTEIYEWAYELHTTTPESVAMAGGVYLDEDGWVGNLNVGGRYLLFLLDGTNAPKLLENHIAMDVYYDSPMFAAGVADALVEAGALRYSELDPEAVWNLFCDRPEAFLNKLGGESEAEQLGALKNLCGWYFSGEGDAARFDDIMDGLHSNRGGLSRDGMVAYERLLDLSGDPAAMVSGGLPMDPEALLDGFEADPAVFLQRAAAAPNRAEALALLARYYDKGASDLRARFSDVLHSVRDEDLTTEAVEAYEILRQSCNLPGPAERDGFDEAGISNAVYAWAGQWEQTRGIASFDLLHYEVDETATAQYVGGYTASLYANANGLTDDYIARTAAVLVVFDVSIDEFTAGVEAAASGWDDGLNAECLFIRPPVGTAPDQHPNEGWIVADSMNIRLPERYQNGVEGLPLADIAQGKTVVTTFASFEEAYAECITRRHEVAGSSFQVFEELRSGGCAAVSWGYTTPHGVSGNLSVFCPDGSVVDLPLPPWSELGLANPAENLSFTEDGQTLTYTASFPDTLLTADGGAVIHRAGTYQYTYDVTAGENHLSIVAADEEPIPGSGLAG